MKALLNDHNTSISTEACCRGISVWLLLAFTAVYYMQLLALCTKSMYHQQNVFEKSLKKTLANTIDYAVRKRINIHWFSLLKADHVQQNNALT